MLVVIWSCFGAFSCMFVGCGFTRTVTPTFALHQWLLGARLAFNQNCCCAKCTCYVRAVGANC